MTIRYPFADQPGSKIRPAIFISDRNHLPGSDAHFVFVGSQLPPPHLSPLEVRRGSREATAMGLLFEPGKDLSYIYPEKLATIDLSLVVRKLGATPDHLLRSITQRVAQVLGLAR